MIHQLGYDLIRQEESFRAEPYQDDAGVWTIGYGHTGRLDGVPVEDHSPVSEEYAREVLEEDIEEFEADVRRLVTAPLTELQFAALVCFVFNLGATNLASSTLLRLLNRGDYEGAAWEFRKWRIAGGTIMPGLITRRGREEQLFRSSPIAHVKEDP
jgi:lysozyme